jgi:hypothetical protein
MNRLPHAAKHAIILSLDGEILVLWTPDPDLAAQLKAGDARDIDRLILNPANEIETVATARRFYKRDGADFSGWVVESSGGNNSDGIANKHEAMRALRVTVADYFTREK